MKSHHRSSLFRIPVYMAFCVSMIIIPACDNDDNTTTVNPPGQPQPDPSELISATVPASTGGTFTDSEISPQISITIPPNALSEDATITVNLNDSPAAIGENQTAGSNLAFDINLTPADGDGDLTLSQPMRMALKTDTPPEHPQIGEIGALVEGKWVRMPANFYRASDKTTLALSTRTANTFRVVHRTLKTEKDAEAVARGRDLYFNETYGNEKFFGELYGLDQVLEAVSPNDVIPLGVQVDATKLPAEIIEFMTGDDFQGKQDAFASNAFTRQLLQLDAIIGVTAKFENPNDPNDITSAGLNCTICHVAVTKTAIQLENNADPALLPIGVPVLGPPNTSMNAGAILSATPLVQNGSENQFLNSDYLVWGPGRADPRFFPGNPFNDNVTNPTSIPPHWNFLDLGEQGYTYTWQGVVQGKGEGTNNLAAAPECGIDFVMNANGAWGAANATVPLTGDDIGNPLTADQQQIFIDAESADPGNEIAIATLTDLQAFLRSLTSPPPGEFDAVKAEAGWDLFYGKANCNACHNTAEGTASRDLPQRFFKRIAKDTDPGGLLNNGIKTPGLRGLALTAPYFHDGSAATLLDVMERYSSGVPAVPTLTALEQEALAEYLLSL